MKAVERHDCICFVRAHPDLLQARLAFGCSLLGSLFSTFAVLCTQQACWRVFGHTSLERLPEPKRAVGDCEFRRGESPRRLRSSSESRPVICALSAPS